MDRINKNYMQLSYSVLQIIRRLINKVFKGFRFRFDGVRGTRETYEKVMQGKIIEMP